MNSIIVSLFLIQLFVAFLFSCLSMLHCLLYHSLILWCIIIPHSNFCLLDAWVLETQVSDSLGICSSHLSFLHLLMMSMAPATNVHLHCLLNFQRTNPTVYTAFLISNVRIKQSSTWMCHRHLVCNQPKTDLLVTFSNRCWHYLLNVSLVWALVFSTASHISLRTAINF